MSGWRPQCYDNAVYGLKLHWCINIWGHDHKQCLTCKLADRWKISCCRLQAGRVIGKLFALSALFFFSNFFKNNDQMLQMLEDVCASALLLLKVTNLCGTGCQSSTEGSHVGNTHLL